MGFEPTIPENEWPETYVLDRAVIEIGLEPAFPDLRRLQTYALNDIATDVGR
jgi:hypothetical protein